MTSTAVLAEPSASQLLNGDFEDWTGNDPDNWTIWDLYGSVEDETTEKYLGSYSVNVTINAGQYVYLYQEVIGLTEGNSLTADVYVLENDADLEVELGMIQYDVPGGSVKAAVSIDTSTDDANWQQLSGSDTVRTDANVARIRYYCLNTGGVAKSLYIDTASISGPDVDEFSVPALILTASAFMVAFAVIRKTK